MTLRVGLRDDATLANFYSHHNGSAVAAVTSLADGQGEPYLYLWGESGAGCSHLLQAACHQAGSRGRSAFYLPLDLLLQQGPVILEGLETLELVCIDQLHRLAGIPEWEEGLFHLYNRLREANRSLLIAANRAPRQLRLELPDLASRLSWGVVYRIEALDDSAKQAALQARAHARGIELTDEVAQFILHRSPRQTGELFELLDQLDRASLSAQRKVTIPFVKQTLGW